MVCDQSDRRREFEIVAVLTRFERAIYSRGKPVSVGCGRKWVQTYRRVRSFAGIEVWHPHFARDSEESSGRESADRWIEFSCERCGGYERDVSVESGQLWN